MNASGKVATVGATLALGLTPALAAGAQGKSASHVSPKAKSHQTATPGLKASMPAKAKAYGRYCKGQSKKHIKGEKGSPFSRCVTDMAKLAKGSTSSPREACKDEQEARQGHKGHAVQPLRLWRRQARARPQARRRRPVHRPIQELTR